jgi:hypothetical protein
MAQTSGIAQSHSGPPVVLRRSAIVFRDDTVLLIRRPRPTQGVRA